MNIQDRVEKAYESLKEFICKQDEIQSQVWLGAMLIAITDIYIKSKVSHDRFCQDMDQIKTHYKKWFDET